MEAMTPSDPTLRRAYFAVALSGAVASLGLLSVGLAAEALGTLAGALLGLGNLYTLARAVSALLEGRGASWGFVVFVKFVTLLGIAYALLVHGELSALGFSVGLGALPVGIVIATFLPAASPVASSSSAPPFKNETDHA